MSLRDQRQRGFTLLELLVVIAILGALIGLIVPALSSARRQAKRTACLANLHSLSGAATAYAADDPRGTLIPVHPIADRNPRHDEGFFDYGGATGARNVWGGTRFGPSSERTSDSRPLNRVLFSSTPSAKDTAWRLFRCPADEGLTGAGGDPLIWDPNMSSQSMFDSVGTSYMGNAYRARTPGGRGQPPRMRSIGPFLRSAGQIPVPGSTVLLCEAVMWYNPTMPVGIDGAVGWRGLPGWHEDGPRYNTMFADAHAEFVYAPAGGLVGGSDPTKARVYLRGRGFRFDTFPAPPIEDPPAAIQSP